MQTPKILAALKSPQSERFQLALRMLEQGLAEKQIWNVDFEDAKHSLSYGEEKAMQVAVEPCRRLWRESPCSVPWAQADPRHDITGYMDHNRAPKLLRNLEKWQKKTNLEACVVEYMGYLRELVEIGNLIKSVKPYIVKGRKPNQNHTPEQLREAMANTGICAICENRQKLDARKRMVHHGYQMSDYNHSGERLGRCFGCDYLPYEFSCEGNQKWRLVLQQRLEGEKAYLGDLTASTMGQFEIVREVRVGYRRELKTDTYIKGTREYERERETRLYRTQREIPSLLEQIAHQTAKIGGWRLQPLTDGSTLDESERIA